MLRMIQYCSHNNQTNTIHVRIGVFNESKIKRKNKKETFTVSRLTNLLLAHIQTAMIRTSVGRKHEYCTRLSPAHKLKFQSNFSNSAAGGELHTIYFIFLKTDLEQIYSLKLQRIFESIL